MRLDHLLSKEKERSKEWKNYCLVMSVYKRIDTGTFLVAMRQGDTPVPIPNTMVKTLTADGTMLETAWESRWLPD